MEKHFAVQGIKSNRIEAPLRTSDPRELIHNFDGYALDEIQLACVITSRQDIEALINFLTVSKECFNRPSKKETLQIP